MALTKSASVKLDEDSSHFMTSSGALSLKMSKVWAT